MNCAAPILGCILAASSLYAAADAQVPGDPRIASLAWVSGARLPLAISPGNSVTVIFASSERIQSVTVDDPGAVEVTPSSNGDSLVIHTLRSLPPLGLVVETDRRSYRFNLVPAIDTNAPYLVRMTYPATAAAFNSMPAAPRPGGIWKVTGAKALTPTAISDDGTHTYVRWSRDQLIPAVFAVNDVGGEELVDGYMRGDVYTIDRINRRLVFRIDKAKASAVRSEDTGAVTGMKP